MQWLTGGIVAVWWLRANRNRATAGSPTPVIVAVWWLRANRNGRLGRLDEAMIVAVWWLRANRNFRVGRVFSHGIVAVWWLRANRNSRGAHRDILKVVAVGARAVAVGPQPPDRYNAVRKHAADA